MLTIPWILKIKLVWKLYGFRECLDQFSKVNYIPYLYQSIYLSLYISIYLPSYLDSYLCRKLAIFLSIIYLIHHHLFKEGNIIDKDSHTLFGKYVWVISSITSHIVESKYFRLKGYWEPWRWELGKGRRLDTVPWGSLSLLLSIVSASCP